MGPRVSGCRALGVLVLMPVLCSVGLGPGSLVDRDRFWGGVCSSGLKAAGLLVSEIVSSQLGAWPEVSQYWCQEADG